MTVDQRNSSNNPNAIPLLLELGEGKSETGKPLLPFQRTAGDEAQAVFDDVQALLATSLLLSRQGFWHIGIGKGAIDEPTSKNAREGKGEAYINAREAVERAKKSSGHVAYESDGKYAGLIEASLQLVLGLEEERSDSRQEVGELYEEGITQTAIAEQLGTYQSAVSRLLKQGKWQESRRIIKELAGLLEEDQ
ncbi:hypothetical protein [Rothia sp. ZJ932]|uniref:hypothetical protein n=1 Tax=Rothia sp. ZJ932 TaxID=2810516 RepID=UPI001967D3AE|nr:hypothetical protein [Rothia sp. ZJ932]QRZ60819.1 hypothetical protein JR346_05870 [Rothia sp. ZJ932]